MERSDRAGFRFEVQGFLRFWRGEVGFRVSRVFYRKGHRMQLATGLCHSISLYIQVYATFKARGLYAWFGGQTPQKKPKVPKP